MTSPDGINWTQYEGNPVIDIGPAGTWEDEDTRTPTVLVDEAGYKMWYCGNDGRILRIGFAASPQDCRDLDGDDSFDEACGGWDCDDSNPEIHPEAGEICSGGTDEDCDGLVDGDDPDCIPIFTL